MNVDVLKKQIMLYAGKLREQRLSDRKGDFFAARIDDDTFVCSSVEVAPSELSDNDFVLQSISSPSPEYALPAAILKSRPEVGAVLINAAHYCATAAAMVKKIRPALDDMAQIIGPSVRRAESMDAKQIIKAMKGRNACITSVGAVTTGRTPDEAFTACLVLEKGTRVFVLAQRVGGAKVINPFEAILMHVIYQKKYSKADQNAKMQEIKE